MNPAIEFYLACKKLNGKRSDFVLDDLKRFAMASLKLSADQRRNILVGLAAIIAREVDCPACGHHGPHASNNHHRFGSITYTCAACARTFKLVTTKETTT